MNSKHSLLFILLLALVACAAPAAPQASSQPLPTEFVWPQEDGACTLRAQQAGPLYQRPSLAAQVFGQMEDGFSTQVIARTADGWVGFDPGVAQAANLGVFRMRWAPAGEVELTGNCLALPAESWLPQPQACYTMPMEAVPVYAEPNPGAEHSLTLEVGQFAAVLGLTPDGAWAKIQLDDGNSGRSGPGWLEAASLNLNGPSCAELPSAQP